jgi:DNA-binding CsgD family transcriptional regulator
MTPLSDRQLQVANLLLSGKSCKEIAGILAIHPRTVAHHVSLIRTKTDEQSTIRALLKVAQVNTYS